LRHCAKAVGFLAIPGGRVACRLIPAGYRGAALTLGGPAVAWELKAGADAGAAAIVEVVPLETVCGED
jgi:hypothetical protein